MLEGNDKRQFGPNDLEAIIDKDGLPASLSYRRPSSHGLPEKAARLPEPGPHSPETAAESLLTNEKTLEAVIYVAVNGRLVEILTNIGLHGKNLIVYGETLLSDDFSDGRPLSIRPPDSSPEPPTARRRATTEEIPERASGTPRWTKKHSALGAAAAIATAGFMAVINWDNAPPDQDIVRAEAFAAPNAGSSEAARPAPETDVSITDEIIGSPSLPAWFKQAYAEPIYRALKGRGNTHRGLVLKDQEGNVAPFKRQALVMILASLLFSETGGDPLAQSDDGKRFGPALLSAPTANRYACEIGLVSTDSKYGKQANILECAEPTEGFGIERFSPGNTVTPADMQKYIHIAVRRLNVYMVDAYLDVLGHPRDAVVIDDKREPQSDKEIKLDVLQSSAQLTDEQRGEQQKAIVQNALQRWFMDEDAPNSNARRAEAQRKASELLVLISQYIDQDSAAFSGLIAKLDKASRLQRAQQHLKATGLL